MLKAIIHGGIAARLTGEIGSVNIICGLGTIFIRSDVKMAIIRRLVLLILSRVFRSPCAQVVFQNDANRDLLLKTYRVLRTEQAHVTPGNGESEGCASAGEGGSDAGPLATGGNGLAAHAFSITARRTPSKLYCNHTTKT